jgi:cytochrome oxidase Cu insertion factor (SCO1/SenC/PrrC family)
MYIDWICFFRIGFILCSVTSLVTTLSAHELDSDTSLPNNLEHLSKMLVYGSKTDNKIDASAFFYGHVGGSAYKGDSVYVFFAKDFITSSNGTLEETKSTKSSMFIVKTDGNGYFHFSIKDIQKPGRLRIGLFAGKDHELVNYYIIEPRDSVQMEIQKDTDNINVHYFGKSAAKYQLMETLSNKNYNYSFNVGGYLIKEVQANHYSATSLDKFWKDQQKYCDSDVALVGTYRDRISSFLYKRTKAETIDFFQRAWLEALKLMYINPSRSTDEQKNIANAIRRHHTDFDHSLSGIYASSENSVYFLLEKEVIEQFFNTGAQPSLSEIYSLVRKKYTGLLREHLCTELLIAPNAYWITNNDGAMFDKCVADASMFVKKTLLRDAIRRLATTYKKGMEAFNFDLKDSADRSVRLSDFEGKLVLMDVWFTGCTGCSVFHHMFKSKIYPEFEGENDFRVISISADRDKATWLKSARSDRYTDFDLNYVNLFTNGLQFNDPMFKYYRPQAFPFIILIDKHGRLIARITDAGNVDQIKDMIRENL